MILCSCGTGMSIRKSKVRYFDSRFSATVNNKSYKVKGGRYSDLTLLNLFEIRDENIDSVHISFIGSKQLKLTYIYKKQEITRTFTGDFAKKGYFEIYLMNQKKEIPPLVPIIYSNNHIKRIRLAITVDGNLIIDNMWDESGNIFILGAGSRGRRQSFYKSNVPK